MKEAQHDDALPKGPDPVPATATLASAPAPLAPPDPTLNPVPSDAYVGVIENGESALHHRPPLQR